jgi:hypothetical protein
MLSLHRSSFATACGFCGAGAGSARNSCDREVYNDIICGRCPASIDTNQIAYTGGHGVRLSNCK